MRYNPTGRPPPSPWLGVGITVVVAAAVVYWTPVVSIFCSRYGQECRCTVDAWSLREGRRKVELDEVTGVTSAEDGRLTLTVTGRGPDEILGVQTIGVGDPDVAEAIAGFVNSSARPRPMLFSWRKGAGGMSLAGALVLAGILGFPVIGRLRTVVVTIDPVRNRLRARKLAVALDQVVGIEIEHGAPGAHRVCLSLADGAWVALSPDFHPGSHHDDFANELRKHLPRAS